MNINAWCKAAIIINYAIDIVFQTAHKEIQWHTKFLIYSIIVNLSNLRDIENIDFTDFTEVKRDSLL